jgi:hypothetical protein
MLVYVPMTVCALHFKTLLILSHGQATVESGFSVNEKILIENMKEKSLIAQRLTCDQIYHSGGHLNVELSKVITKGELLQ